MMILGIIDSLMLSLVATINEYRPDLLPSADKSDPIPAVPPPLFFNSMSYYSVNLLYLTPNSSDNS